MSINTRLFDIIESKNIKNKDLAEYLNINTSVISTWKTRGTNPPSEYLVRICDFLQISLEYLLTGTSASKIDIATNSSEEDEILKAINTLNTKQKAIIVGKIYEYEEINKQEELKRNTLKLTVVEPKTVPLKEETSTLDLIILPLYDQKVSAGLGKYNFEGDNYTEVEFDINEYPHARRADHVTTVEGNSMSPTIEDGEYIFIKEQTEVEHNEIGVFVYKDTVYCKRLHIDRKNKRLTLLSDNKQYKNIEIENIEELRTIGRVIL